jgi:hypothetical protein
MVKTRYYNFIFFLNYVLHKIVRTLRKPLKIFIFILSLKTSFSFCLRSFILSNHKLLGNGVDN